MRVLKFDLASRRISEETTPTVASAVHADLLTDTLYVASGTSIVPMHLGAQATGRWKGPRFKLPTGAHFGFGWLRLNGELSILGAVVKLYGDGVLVYTTPTLNSNEPVRVPPFMHRSWEIELISKARITSAALAETLQELV